MGGYISGSSDPWHVSFRGIDPGGPASRAGIREGDLIEIRDQSPLVRLSLMGQPLAGRPTLLQVKNSDGSSRKAVFVPGPNGTVSARAVGDVGKRFCPTAFRGAKSGTRSLLYNRCNLDPLRERHAR
jgi:hypothetical protein